MFYRTSNIVERLVSRAKLTLDDQRKRVLPMHFEQQAFLWRVFQTFMERENC